VKDYLQKLDSSLKDLLPCNQFDQSRLLTSIMCLAGEIIGVEIDTNRNQTEGKMIGDVYYHDASLAS